MDVSQYFQPGMYAALKNTLHSSAKTKKPAHLHLMHSKMHDTLTKPGKADPYKHHAMGMHAPRANAHPARGKKG